jgi:hypothetical protein
VDSGTYIITVSIKLAERSVNCYIIRLSVSERKPSVADISAQCHAEVTFQTLRTCGALASVFLLPKREECLNTKTNQKFVFDIWRSVWSDVTNCDFFLCLRPQAVTIQTMHRQTVAGKDFQGSGRGLFDVLSCVRCPGRYSKQQPPEQKSRTLPQVRDKH